MLIQFRAENFLSIKGSVVLSLLASKDKEHPKHLIVNGSKRYLNHVCTWKYQFQQSTWA